VAHYSDSKQLYTLREEILADQPICQIQHNLVELILAVQEKSKLAGRYFGG